MAALSSWLRRNALTEAHRRWIPAVEFATLAISVIVALATWQIVESGSADQRLMTPVVVALLLIGNLVPAIALLVLIGRRIAKRRARRSIVGGDGRLHVRLVAIFSLVASVPTLLVVVFSSLLFQAGVQFWFSDRAKATLEGAAAVAQESYAREQAHINANTVTMAGDLARDLRAMSLDNPQFLGILGAQLYQRELSEGMVLHATPSGEIQSLVLLNPYERDIGKFITPALVEQVHKGADVVTVSSPDGIGALSRLPIGHDNYLYAARVTRDFGEQIRRARLVLADYRELGARSRSLQLRFNAALMIISLLIVATAVWIALGVADRLVRPIGQLVDAAQRVTGGELSARIAGPHTPDEVGTLAAAFNRMTARLQEQTRDLIAANDQIDRRRALIEAVLSGVSAGVVSVDGVGEVRLTNASAAALLASRDTILVGRTLADVAPELAAMIERGATEDVVAIASPRGDARTLAVKVASDDLGHVLTFDDITQQLSDQRRAAWSDVARRIAHEIKNPLTPIQLAAERLQRRYGNDVANDPATFAKLTGTIVRQVGDLRRMVDEFSSFARMPKPVFRSESLIDIARHSLFLHEVAHPEISFRLSAPDTLPEVVCDRRQLGQALTNIIKNAVEAIGARGSDGTVDVAISRLDDAHVELVVTDNGIGLPSNREQLVEPYVTSRAGGTGLGLAIVKKIVEEHYGTMTLGDGLNRGTAVTLTFDTDSLSRELRTAAAIEPMQAAG